MLSQFLRLLLGGAVNSCRYIVAFCATYSAPVCRLSDSSSPYFITISSDLCTLMNLIQKWNLFSCYNIKLFFFWTIVYSEYMSSRLVVFESQDTNYLLVPEIRVFTVSTKTKISFRRLNRIQAIKLGFLNRLHQNNELTTELPCSVFVDGALPHFCQID